MAQCKYCETTPKSWNGDDRNCAFKDGVFSKDNWNCASMNKLRHIAEVKELRQYGEDISCAMLRVPEVKNSDDEWKNNGFCILSWYKDRGCTSNAVFISDEIETPLRFEQVEAILKHYNVVA
jgi:hypothetical protein